MRKDLSSSRRGAIDAFLEKSRVLPSRRGRLIFALDATASRQPTWDIACRLQGEMFSAAAAIGSLYIQLVYYRGASECCASPWMSDGTALAERMERITCVPGRTQIGKLLAHALQQNLEQQIHALVFVGDWVEEEPAELFSLASQVGRSGVPIFVFQEGDDRDAADVFAKIARLTKGAHCRFAPGAAHELGELLRAAAAYATGGIKALANVRSSDALKLLTQLRSPR